MFSTKVSVVKGRYIFILKSYYTPEIVDPELTENLGSYEDLGPKNLLG